MSTRRTLALLCVSVSLWLVAAAFAQSGLDAPKPNLGTPVSEADIAAWDIHVLPDGTGLPPGSGTPEQGAKVYTAKCAACHGPEGKGGTNAALVGGRPLTDGIDTPKTIANFWAHATTLFDFTRRAMPWPAPRTLTNDETYALTAYILSLNKIIGPNDVINAQTAEGRPRFAVVGNHRLLYQVATRPAGKKPPSAGVSTKLEIHALVN